MFFLFTRKLYWKWKKFWCNSSLLEFVSKRLVSKRRPISSGGESEFPPLSGPRFLLTFFPFSDFAKHSTIWRPGTDQLWIHVFNTIPNIRDLTNFSMISLSQNLLLHNYLSHNFLYDFFVTEFIDERSYGAAQIRNAVRQNILRLILHSLQHPSPNLAHFLMGFELRKPASKTNLQDPGK